MSAPLAARVKDPQRAGCAGRRSLTRAASGAFDQESDLVLDLGGHGDGDGGFEDAFGQRLGADIDRNFHLRRFLLEEDGRGIGLLERHVLQVHALDLEYGLQVFVGHKMLSLDEIWTAHAVQSVCVAAVKMLLAAQQRLEPPLLLLLVAHQVE